MLYDNFREILQQIQYLDSKKRKLEELLEGKKFTNIQIHFFSDSVYHTIYQSDSPFNMEHELRVLISGMIEQLDFDIQNLKLQF